MIFGKKIFGIVAIRSNSKRLKNKNIYGFQFHPEKSHITGLEIIKDFF